MIREVIIPEEVQADPEAWEWISDEVTEELDIEPTRFIKRLIIRPKYVRKGVVDAKPVVAKLPLVEITKTGPLEKLVWAPIKDPDNEIKTIHNRTEDPHPSGC